MCRYGLPWAFPGWVGNGTGSPFADGGALTSNYILQWLKGAREEYGVEIDYIGVWNERSSDATYVQTLKKTLADAGFPKVQIVAKDGGSDICTDMAKDPAYKEAVDIIGLHYPSDYSDYTTCHSLDKPFWASEESSSYDDINGAACWARVVTSHYVLAKITSSIMWNLIGSYYHGTNWYASSMITAVEPWSGHYPVDDEDMGVVYATAHVTQFTEVGWHYLPVGAGSGQLPGGGFYVTIVDPAGSDFTMNVVKIDESHAPCTRPHLPSFNVSSEQVTFKLDASMKAPAKLAVWYSNFEMADPVVFKQMPDVSVVNGEFSLAVPVGSFFTISTITDATKGVNYKPPPSSIQFPLPYIENMEEVEPSQEAKYFADQIGAYEVHYETGESGNKVLQQMVPALPIGWSDHGSNGPMTLIGMREWADLAIKVSFKLPELGAEACIGSRVDQMWNDGIVLCVDAAGAYNLTVGGPTLPKVNPDASRSTSKASWAESEPQQVSYASGVAETLVGVGSWHVLELTTIGSTASGSLDGKVLFTDQAIRGMDTGFAALGMNDWFFVEFDDFSIHQAGSDWAPVSPCGAAKVGDVLTARNCSTNGLPVADEEWELMSSWQLKHIPSGLCAEAESLDAGAKVKLATCHPIGSEEGDLQQFKNDYTRIRNAMAPMTLSESTMKLSGNVDGTISVAGWAVGEGKWSTW